MQKTIIYFCFGVLSFSNEIFLSDLAFHRFANLYETPPALRLSCNRTLLSWSPLNHLIPDGNLRRNDLGPNCLHGTGRPLPFPRVRTSDTPDLRVCTQTSPEILNAPFLMFLVSNLGFYLNSFSLVSFG